MLEIITFGDFDIILDGKSIIGELVNSQRLIKLFKYFLAHKDKMLLPETIIDNLWKGEALKNPISLLRAQISRLRKIIAENISQEKEFYSIHFVDGYYIFTLRDDCLVDFIEFENLLNKDYTSLKNLINNDPSIIRSTLNLYRGTFLRDLGDEDWLVPIRTRLDRLYIKVVLYYIDYLKENYMYSEIINICEKTISIKPYEEIIHVTFMETLLELRQTSYALIHYEFFTKKLFKDLNKLPSEELKNVYKKIKSKVEERYPSDIDLNSMDDEMLKNTDFDEILLCDLRHFKFLYNYEKKNKNRHGDKTVGTGIGLITICSKDSEELREIEMEKEIELFKQTLFKVLRCGDIVSQWNQNQILIILYGLREKHIANVIDKINNTFKSAKLDERLSLNIKFNIL